MADNGVPVEKMGFITLLIHLAASIISNVFSANVPGGRAWIYGMNQVRPNAIPDFPSAVDLVLKKEISTEQFYEYAVLYGYDKPIADQILTSARQYIDIQSYVTLFRREKINRTQLLDYMSKLHITEREVDNLLNSTEFFPQAGDLVRFAVREVYSPEVAQKFGLFEDLPDKFITESKKSGMEEEQAKNFWAAHWELPSPLQGFRMLHRRIIDLDTLKLLLRALDVMPFWRDKMVDLSYNPLTRVDVRRMYGLGVIDEDGVYKAYLDVGYSPENAKLMTTFTTRYENSESDGITRANIINAYKDDLIKRDDLLTYLDLLGYSEKIKQFWVDNADFEKTERRIKIIADDAIELYRKGAGTVAEIRARLLKQDLPAVYIDKILEETIQQDAKRRKVPSKSDLDSWLNAQVIEEVYYKEKMALIGYSDTDIEYYLTAVAQNVDTSKRKFLPIKTYTRWLKTEIITEDVFRNITADMGISDDDTDRMVEENLPESD